jgi:elongator complex protein 3
VAAESLARGARMRKILVISAVGARPYFRKFGYERDGVYMSKPLGDGSTN